MPNGPADVRAGVSNLASYTDNGDGTVNDNITGLVWQKGVAPGFYSQPAGLTYCSTLTLGGHHDWRLPTVIELVSIVDYGQTNPGINLTFLPTAADLFFWSSTPLADSPGAWGVDFGPRSGTTDTVAVANTYSVRCVR